MIDLNEGGARQTVRTIKNAGGKAHGYTVDITGRKALETPPWPIARQAKRSTFL
ncbi:hypothetical protein [uncultured Bradyrhizobium sp.]|uniref:hypothetical protein n=1 Tax=uncultured Bradyrhizobium sp. TaxID=199684 RepID=UPI00260954F4|nr:hypothetical protein [uncultured Bradyrhizobium sp.]